MPSQSSKVHSNSAADGTASKQRRHVRISIKYATPHQGEYVKVELINVTS